MVFIVLLLPLYLDYFIGIQAHCCVENRGI